MSVPRNLLFCVLLSLGAMIAQTPAKPAAQDMQVELTATVKAKKVAVGDTVTTVTVRQTRVSQALVVPAGAKVIGHVRKVEADSASSHSSSITLSFDELEIKKGQTVPLHCFIRAALMPAAKGIYAQGIQQGQNSPPIATSERDVTPPSMGSSGPGVADVNNPNALTPAQRDNNPAPVTAHSGQVIGMPGVELEMNTPEGGSAFKSSRKNLELDAGMQLMLVVQL